MVGLVIKNLPDGLHQKLKTRAAQHHRSMTKEAIALLERGLESNQTVQEPPAPYKGKFPLTGKLIDKAKREGRE
jgi:plasmid stability protein